MSAGGLEAKLKSDVGFQLASLAVVGVSGIAFNVAVQTLHGSAGLGVFTQVFAAYMLWSQLAVCGLNASVLRHEPGAPAAERGAILGAALAWVTLTGALAAGTFVLARGAIAGFFQSAPVGEGIPYAAPGLYLFAVNKVLLGSLNARRRMRAFAVIQVVRVVLLVAGVALLAAAGRGAGTLPAILTLAEAGVFLGARFALRGDPAWSTVPRAAWLRANAAFGLRCAPGLLVTDLNSRVVVFALGYFADDRTVGVFGFAAAIADGIHQVVVVMRNNLDPLIAKAVADPDPDALQRLVDGAFRPAWALAAGAATAGVAAFAALVALLGKPELSESVVLLAILMAGEAAAAGYLAFEGLLLQAGRPLLHSSMIAALIVVSAGLCAALIPGGQARGAATADAVAMLVNAALLCGLGRWALGLRW